MQRGKRTQILLFIPAKTQIEKPMLILFIPFCQNANRETYADFFFRFCQNTLKKFYANVSFHSCQNVNKKSTQMLLFIPTKCSVLSIIVFTAIITQFLHGKILSIYTFMHIFFKFCDAFLSLERKIHVNCKTISILMYTSELL